MISINKLMFANIFLAFLFSLSAAETILVPENSLLFKEDKASKKWRIKATAERNFYGEVIKKEKIFLPQGKEIGIAVDAYHLKIPGTDGLCYFSEVIFKKAEDGIFKPHVDKIDSLMFLGTFLFVLGLAAMAGYFHLHSEKKKYLLPAALVLFFWGYALWYIGFVSNSLTRPTDDIVYFDIAKKILAGDFTSMKFRYTVGFPIFCIPFVLLFHLENYLEFILAFMNFQTFILIPGLILLLYAVFHKKLGFSCLQSFSILFLWLILIVFYLPMTGTVTQTSEYIPELYQSNANFSLPEQYTFFLFVQLTWLGRNAMSDYTAVFLLMVLLYAAMQKSRSLIRFFLLSMGFGILCLVRVNYIFFAPLLAFVFYDSFSDLWQKKRNYLYAALCGMAGFMIVFGWQFVLNKIQFGSPLIGPYSLHKYGPDRGFGFNVIPYGFKFLFQANYIYMILGISSLFFIPERKNRVLLTLWIFPMLLFFFGYPGIFNSPTRFIFALYPPLLAAIVMNPIWKAPWNIRIKAALVAGSLCLLCKSNIFFIPFPPWNLGKYGLPNIVFIISQCVIVLFCCAVIFTMRKDVESDDPDTIRHFRFLILFTAVFFLGSLWIYFAGLLVLAALVYGLRDTWAVIRQISGKNVSPEDQIPERNPSAGNFSG